MVAVAVAVAVGHRNLLGFQSFSTSSGNSPEDSRLDPRLWTPAARLMVMLGPGTLSRVEGLGLTAQKHVTLLGFWVEGSGVGGYRV